MNSKTLNLITLILVLVVAIALRFYHFGELTLSHDEFSALFRLNAENLDQLIEYGVVRTDTHPVGVQVFLYYYTMLFGTAPWVIKLPFALLGLAAVYLTYVVGKMWFNTTTALLAAAYMASLQYAIMYSQLTRPYIAGLFFGLLTVFFWTRLIKLPEQNFNRNALGFALSAAACAYIHHFSLLFAFIVGASGLILIPKNKLRKYLFFSALAAILYLPHLGIFFKQLQKGGVGAWLGKPTFYFFQDFIGYLFHFSTPAIGLMLSIVALGYIFRAKNHKYLQKITFFGSWFFVPFVIAYAYSILINPVLQYSVLFFALPYLLFVLFGHIKQMPAWVNLVLVTLILGVNSFTLFTERQHYAIQSQSIYKEVVLACHTQQNAQPSSISLLHLRQDIAEYYIDDLNLSHQFTWLDSLGDNRSILDFLENAAIQTDTFFYGADASAPSHIIPMISKYFPKLVWRKNYFLGEIYLFTKGDQTTENKISAMPFSESYNYWKGIDSSSFFVDSITTKTFYQMSQQAEWSPRFSVPLSEVTRHENDQIDVYLSAEVPEQTTDIDIVTMLFRENKMVLWNATALNKFPRQNSGNIRAWHTLDLAIVEQRGGPLTLQVAIWNRTGAPLEIHEFEIFQRDGNPLRYAINEPITKTLNK